jgi:hypothetical protein
MCEQEVTEGTEMGRSAHKLQKQVSADRFCKISERF